MTLKPANDQTMEQVILETAENLFLEKGFALTSTIEIARVAGCNQALVHYYFRTKERLFDAVFEKSAWTIISSFLEPLAENIPFEEKIRKKIETQYDLLKANPKIPFLFFNELNTNPCRLRGLMEKTGTLPGVLWKQVDEELKAEIEKGVIRPMTATDLLVTILSMNLFLFLAGPVLKVVAGLSEVDMHHLVDNRKRENVTVILKSLRPS
ncbi:MAG: TetR/AcrR family transcriptional regulator [Bacteroidales bacterium]